MEIKKTKKADRLSGVKILRSPDKIFSEEVIRVLAMSPVWEPGVQNDRLVRVKFVLPVDFIIR